MYLTGLERSPITLHSQYLISFLSFYTDYLDFTTIHPYTACISNISFWRFYFVFKLILFEVEGIFFWINVILV